MLSQLIIQRDGTFSLQGIVLNLQNYCHYFSQVPNPPIQPNPLCTTHPPQSHGEPISNPLHFVTYTLHHNAYPSLEVWGQSTGPLPLQLIPGDSKWGTSHPTAHVTRLDRTGDETQEKHLEAYLEDAISMHTGKSQEYPSTVTPPHSRGAKQMS